MKLYLACGATLAERLARRSEPYVKGRCQLWLGAKTKSGYGEITWQGRTIYTHRAAWECERGPIPKGMDVLHRCDVRACRNIDHLWLGTQSDNNADMIAKGRHVMQRGRAVR